MPENDPTKKDPLDGFLGGLMGDAQQGGMPAETGSGDPLSSILGGLMGGAQQGGMQSGAPGAAAPDNNALLAPIVNAIAEKFGISPQIVETIVSFALSQLMSGKGDQLGQMLGGKGTVSQEYLRDSGLADQLTQRTGMDSETAVKSLQQVFQALGSQMSGGTTDGPR